MGWRIPTSMILAGGFTIGWLWEHYHRVISMKQSDNHNFLKLIDPELFNHSMLSSQMFHRRLERPLPGFIPHLHSSKTSKFTPSKSLSPIENRLTDDDLTNSSLEIEKCEDEKYHQNHEALQALARALFSSKAYKLELALSGAKENPSHFQCKVGERIGHLVLESLPSSTEAIFKYDYTGFDFRLYLSVSDPTHRDAGRHISLGYVDYSDNLVSNIGQFVYSFMLIESAARRLESSWSFYEFNRQSNGN